MTETQKIKPSSKIKLNLERYDHIQQLMFSHLPYFLLLVTARTYFLLSAHLRHSSTNQLSNNHNNDDDDDFDYNFLIETIQEVAVKELEFIDGESDKALMLLKMQEKNSITKNAFTDTVIENVVDLPVSEPSTSQISDINKIYELPVDSYVEKDFQTLESHKHVDRDEETNEVIRDQSVYVDEHDCIGCTNCAQYASQTFFMEEELGRARVHTQWGDTDEDIALAIATCPVDCIHYVPFEELESLEIARRGQNINFKARLVSQSDNRGNDHRVGSAVKFTSQPVISGNAGKMRCNNCPSLGCYDCPMYGVGDNPDYKLREQKRLEKLALKKFKSYVDEAESILEL